MSVTCNWCGQVLSKNEDVDIYDLMNEHIWSCPSAQAKKFRRSAEEGS